MTGPLLLVLLLSLPFLYVLARRPILRRLALRNAVRRPREAALVVVGSLLGAAFITGSLIVGDTMNASIRQLARSHLGPVDELVLVGDSASWRELSARLAGLPRSQVDGVLPLATMEAAATSRQDGRSLAAPRTQVVRVDFGAARAFGGDPGATGVRGPSPPRGHAAVGADLARTLDLAPGDTLDVNAYGTRTALIVDRILPRRGIAGFWLGYEQEARNVLVSPRTFDEILWGSSRFAAPPQWSVAVSNRGGVEGGVTRTSIVKKEIRGRAFGLDAQVMPVKKLALDQANTSGKAFTEMFTAMGSFGVLAGLLLLINLFVMLAAERKAELGMARAVGMRRSWLVGGFATEGWLYALVATLLGTVAGIGLGRVLVALSERIFSSRHSQLQLFFTLKPSSLATAFAISFGIALLTIVATSVRVSRLNIIRAIRDIAEPPPRRRKRWLVLGIGASLLGTAWFASALGASEPFGLLLGPMLLLAGAAPVATRLASARAIVSMLAALAVVWGVSVLAIFSNAAEGAPVTLYVAQGIALTTAAVVLVTMQQDRLAGLLKRSGAHALAARLGLAYPLARRSRTGLTVATYALVVFILTFITTLSHLIDTVAASGTKAVRGGYDVVVSSSQANPVALGELSRVRGVRAVAPLATTSASFRVHGMSEAVPWHLTSFDRRFLEHGPPKLEKRGRYRSDAAAWRAVLAHPNLAIVDGAFLQNTGGPPGFQADIGTKVSIADPVSGRHRTVRIAAISPIDYYIENGAFYGAAGAREVFGPRLVTSRFYVAVAPGADRAAVAGRIQARFIANGAEASPIPALMDEAFTMTHQIFLLFEGYLAMGLLVGVAGIAVVMIRAVRERRRQIGTLRALGFGSRTVGRSFAIESAFVAVEGTVIGCVLALVTLYNIVVLTDAFGEMTFSVPFVPLGLLLLGTVAATLLATVVPAIAATRIRPAVALRMTD